MHLGDLRRWMEERGGDPAGILGAEAGTLMGFELVWNYRSQARGGGAANVGAAPGAALPGVVLELSSTALEFVDRKEGHPSRYSRGECALPVLLHSGVETRAWVYQVTVDFLEMGSVWPSPAYLGILIEAARSFALPEAHIRRLESTPTR